VVLALPLAAQQKAAPKLDEMVGQELPSLVGIYKHLHQNPELSAQEKETAALVAGELRKLGFEVTENFGTYDSGQKAYGVVAVMRNGPGPTVLVRTDMDALPVEERTGLPYASHVKAHIGDVEVSVMHACGHDLHMTSFIGTARMLARLRDQWSGTVVMIGQPAEERVGGAKAMLRDGLYTRFPRPDYAVALHDSPVVPAGKVAWKEGPLLASSDSVDITIRGVGGHGAAPHQTKDPIVIASEVVLALQTIVSREMNPLDPAVVTVGSFHAGTKHNIIPDEAHLQLTVRAYKPETRAKVLASIKRITEGIAAAAGVPADRPPIVSVDENEGAPPTINDAALARRVGAALERALGKENVLPAEQIMAAEDFSLFSLTPEKVPITMFWLGAADPERLRAAQEKGERLPGLHSSEFAPLPEPAIRTGVRAMTSVVLDLLKK
jgi:hippurate hydrolase